MMLPRGAEKLGPTDGNWPAWLKKAGKDIGQVVFGARILNPADQAATFDSPEVTNLVKTMYSIYDYSGLESGGDLHLFFNNNNDTVCINLKPLYVINFRHEKPKLHFGLPGEWASSDQLLLSGVQQPTLVRHLERTDKSGGRQAFKHAIAASLGEISLAADSVSSAFYGYSPSSSGKSITTLRPIDT